MTQAALPKPSRSARDIEIDELLANSTVSTRNRTGWTYKGLNEDEAAELRSRNQKQRMKDAFGTDTWAVVAIYEAPNGTGPKSMISGYRCKKNFMEIRSVQTGERMICGIGEYEAHCTNKAAATDQPTTALVPTT